MQTNSIMDPLLKQSPSQTEKIPLHILIADDHAIVRIGLKIMIKHINSAINIEEAVDGKSVIQKLKSGTFDLLILDINMPRTESFSLTGYLLKEFPALKILVFTINQELLFAKRFLKLGAHGYMTKKSGEPEIRQAIQKILEGQIYVSDLLSEIISNDLINHREDNPFEQLSDREFEVVLQILKGYTVSEIAETLHVNRSTVGTHKSRILNKLGLSNTLELHSVAKKHNIL
jgi:two-component system, NarL family, invasion response regulator UvrY